jgi:tRNA threonylcarbamoyladenosine biosynthesis protein TsaE
VLSPHHYIIPELAPKGRLAVRRDELIAWGERFGRAAQPPLVVGISGELGAGKTTLVQAICRGAGVRDDVTSPTFALVHEYAGARYPVYHLDLYRLENARDLTNIGWDDIMSAHALVLIEWPERAGDRMPPDAVSIELEHHPADPDRRLLLAG